MKVITICNQKGGVGKTTTASALTTGLKNKGYKVLAVDLDAQRNLSIALNVDRTGFTALDVLTGRASITDTIINDVIPASADLVKANTEVDGVGREYKLKEALQEVSANYDYCIIDTPPALGIVTINALASADYVIVPAQADLYNLQGLQDLTNTINSVKKYCNNDKLKVLGVLMTLYDNRTRIDREVSDVIERMAQALNTTLFNTSIRRCTKVKEAVIKRKDIYTYSPTATATQDYKAWIEEVLERM